MKFIMLSLVLVVLAIQVNAAQVELGKYRAVDAETKSIVATFELKANGTVVFNVDSPEFSVSCNGKYAVNGNKFSTNLSCDSFILSSASVTIDISNVNPQSIRSAKGAEVNVIIDAIGDQPVKYLLKKKD